MVSIQVTPVGVGVATQASFFVSLHQGSVQTIGSQPITITLTDPAEDQQEKAMGSAKPSQVTPLVNPCISLTIDTVYGYVNCIGP